MPSAATREQPEQPQEGSNPPASASESTPHMDETEMAEAQNDEAYMRYIQDYYATGEEPAAQPGGGGAATSGTQTINIDDATPPTPTGTSSQTDGSPAAVDSVSGSGEGTNTTAENDGFDVEMEFDIPRGRPMTYREFKKAQTTPQVARLQPQNVQANQSNEAPQTDTGDTDENESTTPNEISPDEQDDAATQMAAPPERSSSSDTASPSSPGDASPLVSEDSPPESSTQTPPVASPATQSAAASDISSAKATNRARSDQQMQSQVQPLDDQIAELESAYRAALRADRSAKIRANFAKLASTAEFILPILWYLIKFLYILLIYNGNKQTKAIGAKAAEARSQRDAMVADYQ